MKCSMENKVLISKQKISLISVPSIKIRDIILWAEKVPIQIKQDWQVPHRTS